jgi:ferredoxin-NADP reductase
MAYQFYNSKVVAIIDETPIVKRFFFKIPHLQKFEFNAGQFVLLDLPIPSKITTRAYSIACAPPEDNIIELVIVLKEDGLGTPYLFNEVGVGSDVLISEPIGKFVRPRPESFLNDVCFICTGTGIAPFRSMILDIKKHKIEYPQMYLIFGARMPQDILYFKEMKDLEKEMNNFNFIPVLSRAKEPEWTGKKGYVHDVYLDLFKDKRPALFYLCGWKSMIMEAKKNLMDLGYSKDQIRFELYD